MKRLIPLWELQRTEVVTAHLRYKVFHCGGSDLLSASPATINKICASFDPEQSNELTNSFKSIRKLPGNPWDTMESYFDGHKIKEVGPHAIQVASDELKLEYDKSNKIVSVLSAGKSPLAIAALTQFRYIPPAEGATYRQDGRDSNGRLILSSGPMRLTVDDYTGVVYRFAILNHVGQVSVEILQTGFVSYPGDILFPSLVIDARYSGDKLESIRATAIEDGEFNIDLPDDAFVIGAPAGTHVFDLRNERVRTDVLPQNTRDVAAYANGSVVNTQGTSWKWANPWLAGTLFIAISSLVVAWLRRSRRSVND